jgi:hypothetical protein
MLTIETDTGCLAKEWNGYSSVIQKQTPGSPFSHFLLQYYRNRTGCLAKKLNGYSNVIERDKGCLAKGSNSYYRNRHRLPGEEAEWLLQCYIETDTGCLAKESNGYYRNRQVAWQRMSMVTPVLYKNRHSSPSEVARLLLQYYIETITDRLAK